MGNKSAVALPAAAAIIAIGAAILLMHNFGFKTLDAAIISSLVFCMVMTMITYTRQAYLIENIRKSQQTSLLFEAEIIKKVDKFESTRGTSTLLNKLSERIEVLENSAMENAIVVDEHPFTAPVEVAPENFPDADQPADYDSAKVVQLVTGKSDNNALKLADNEDKKEIEAKKQFFENYLEEEYLQIKLQPIVNLNNREMLAVEASLWATDEDGHSVSIRENSELINPDKKVKLDEFMIRDLGRILRQMESDGQLSSIYCQFFSPKGLERETDQIHSMLVSDPRLAKHLICAFDIEDINADKAGHERAILNIKQANTRLAVRCGDPANLHAKLPEFVNASHFLIKTEKLLAYQSGTERRAAERIISQIESKNGQIIATDLDARHQAAALLDLDISTAMGELISPARTIRLYESSSKTAENLEPAKLDAQS